MVQNSIYRVSHLIILVLLGNLKVGKTMSCCFFNTDFFISSIYRYTYLKKEVFRKIINWGRNGNLNFSLRLSHWQSAHKKDRASKETCIICTWIYRITFKPIPITHKQIKREKNRISERNKKRLPLQSMHKICFLNNLLSLYCLNSSTLLNYGKLNRLNIIPNMRVQKQRHHWVRRQIVITSWRNEPIFYPYKRTWR